MQINLPQKIKENASCTDNQEHVLHVGRVLCWLHRKLRRFSTAVTTGRDRSRRLGRAVRHWRWGQEQLVP